jgi:Heterokaryon incompatibility protein (HET)
MSDMKRGMPINSLPKTFQDAMIVAKHLSMQYIWIDSLCILQDSIEDWQQESAKMMNIYRYAELNITATAAA